MKGVMNKIILKGGYVPTPIEKISEHNSEISRGIGIRKPKKGKGSYSRRYKYKNF